VAFAFALTGCAPSGGSSHQIDRLTVEAGLAEHHAEFAVFHEDGAVGRLKR
jgi:hypothetical protein